MTRFAESTAIPHRPEHLAMAEDLVRRSPAGTDLERFWAEHDACELVKRRPFGGTILVDQGLDDKFLATQLQPERFEAACAEAGQGLRLRRHAGYDHGYYFIASFIEDHLRHHAALLAD